MHYKTVLVIFQNSDDAAALMQAANQIAKTHDAHIIGLYVTAPPDVYMPGTMPISADLIKQCEQHAIETAAAIKHVFDRSLESEGTLGEWREVLSSLLPVSETLYTLANACDIVVLGQNNEKEVSNDIKNLAEKVVLAVGRPTLMVPTSGKFGDLQNTVFVAWDGSRESSRAAYDALPLLKQASEVTLLTINSQPSERRSMFSPSAVLVNSLARHDVNVTLLQTHAGRADVSGEILYSIKDKAANLLVMGAYGTSRIRELLFGGVTKEVLDQVDIPVLLSH